MTRKLRTCVGALVALGVGVFLMVFACKEDPTPPTKNPQPTEDHRIALLQSQLSAEQAQRIRAEQEARIAEESRTTWITGLIAGSIVICLVIGLLGIHIGSRARRRARKEAHDG